MKYKRIFSFKKMVIFTIIETHYYRNFQINQNTIHNSLLMDNIIPNLFIYKYYELYAVICYIYYIGIDFMFKFNKLIEY